MMRTFIFLAGLVFLISPVQVLGQTDPLKKDKDKNEPSIKDKFGNPKDSRNTPVNGRVFDEWLEIIKKSRDEALVTEAIQMIQLYGAETAIEAVPRLVGMLGRHVPGPRGLDTSIRSHAIAAIGNILANKKEPDPKLMAKAIAQFQRMLRDSEDHVRFKTVLAVVQLGPEASVLAKYLSTITIKDRRTWEIRYAAALALGSIGVDKNNGPNIWSLKGLAYAVEKDTSADVRVTAVRAITYLGPPKPHQVQLRQDVRNALLKATSDKHIPVRIWANMALMNLDGKSDPARVEAIGNLLDYKQRNVRFQAARALTILGVEAKTQVRNLIKALEDEDPEIVLQVIVALGTLKGHGRAALEKLNAIEKGKDDKGKYHWPLLFRRVAAQSIASIEGRKMEPVGAKKDKEAASK